MELNSCKSIVFTRLQNDVHHVRRIKKDLKLSDRTYTCECGLKIDRDLNAALNLAKAGTISSVITQKNLLICRIRCIRIYACGVSYQMRVATAKADT